MNENLSIVLVIVATLLSITTVSVFKIISDHQVCEREVLIGGYKPPLIEQCDKETWDRIREGCDEQLDEGED